MDAKFYPASKMDWIDWENEEQILCIDNNNVDY